MWLPVLNLQAVVVAQDDGDAVAAIVGDAEVEEVVVVLVVEPDAVARLLDVLLDERDLGFGPVIGEAGVLDGPPRQRVLTLHDVGEANLVRAVGQGVGKGAVLAFIPVQAALPASESLVIGEGIGSALHVRRRRGDQRRLVGGDVLCRVDDVQPTVGRAV